MAVDRPFPGSLEQGAASQVAPFLATCQTVLKAAELFWTVYDHSENTPGSRTTIAEASTPAPGGLTQIPTGAGPVLEGRIPGQDNLQ
jgi:hypothetical protein